MRGASLPQKWQCESVWSFALPHDWLTHHHHFHPYPICGGDRDLLLSLGVGGDARAVLLLAPSPPPVLLCGDGWAVSGLGVRVAR